MKCFVIFGLLSVIYQIKIAEANLDVGICFNFEIVLLLLNLSFLKYSIFGMLFPDGLMMIQMLGIVMILKIQLMLRIHLKV